MPPRTLWSPLYGRNEISLPIRPAKLNEQCIFDAKKYLFAGVLFVEETARDCFIPLTVGHNWMPDKATTGCATTLRDTVLVYICLHKRISPYRRCVGPTVFSARNSCSAIINKGPRETLDERRAL